jgi:hypothetical protein
MSTFLFSAAKHAMSASNAAEKVAKLEFVLTRYYTGWQPYDGKSAIDSVQMALAYVVSKKSTKTKRKAGQAAATMAFGTAGAIIGGAAGTVALPGAGTALGAVTVGTIVGSAPTIGTQLFRKSKFLYKTLRGTQGVHRKEAATALYHGCKLTDKSKHAIAAAAGVAAILNDDKLEIELLMLEKNAASAIETLAKRLKSW